MEKLTKTLDIIKRKKKLFTGKMCNMKNIND